MDKNEIKTDTKNKQEKLSNSVNSVPGDNQNQNHNTRKAALGKNTKR